MKKTKVLSFLLICSIILGGCAKNREEENPADDIEVGEGQVLEYAYGSGIIDYNGETITYDSEYLEIPFEYFNDGNALQAGLLIFINGIPQSYSADDSEFAYYHIFDIGKEKTIEINLKIKPNIGKKGDNLNLNFVSVLNPTLVNSLRDYRFNHLLNQPMGTNLEYLIDVEENYTKPQNLAVQEQIAEDDLNRYKEDDSVVIEAYQENGLAIDYLKTNELTKIKVTGYSGEYVLYKVYDGIHLDPNGVLVGASRETYDVVDIGELPKDVKNVYFLLVPLDTVHFIEQSERFIVE